MSQPEMYQFVRTIQGPVIVGPGEVLTFYQWPQMQDYYMEDPEFINNAKKFLAETIEEFSALIVKSIYEPIIGAEYVKALPTYFNAIDGIRGFENQAVNR